MARGALRNIGGDHFLRRLAADAPSACRGPAEPAPVTQGRGGRNRTGDGEAAARWEPSRKGGTAGHCMCGGAGGPTPVCIRTSISLRRFYGRSPKCRVFHRRNEFHRDNYAVVIHKSGMPGMSECGEAAGPECTRRLPDGHVRSVRYPGGRHGGRPGSRPKKGGDRPLREWAIDDKVSPRGWCAERDRPRGSRAPAANGRPTRERGVVRSRDLATPRRVGVTGFEPATLPSRTARATKLRHTPVDLRRSGSPRRNSSRLPAGQPTAEGLRARNVSKVASGGVSSR